MIRVLLLFALGFLVGHADAASIYKCTDSQNYIAYQDRPCAARLVSHTLVLKPRAPAAATPPADADGRRAKAVRPGKAARTTAAPHPRSTASAASLSWECRIANGEVFYQHSPCPGRVAARSKRFDPATRGYSLAAAAPTAVSARALERGEACRRIHAASAGSRAGHARDEDVSSYARSLGRDPCR